MMHVSLLLQMMFWVNAEAAIQPAKPVAPPVQPAKLAATPVQAALAQATPVPSAVIPKSSDSALDAILNEDLIRGLRDPFVLPTSALVKKELPKSDLETYALKDLKLNGVVTGPKKVRAMLTGPNGKTFFVKVGDRIGARGGKITRISGDAVRVTEFYQDEKGRDLPDVYELRIAGEMVSLTKKDEDGK
jgi:hypothetical protein